MAATIGAGFCIEVTVFVGLLLLGLVANHTVFLPTGRICVGYSYCQLWGRALFLWCQLDVLSYFMICLLCLSKLF